MIAVSAARAEPDTALGDEETRQAARRKVATRVSWKKRRPTQAGTVFAVRGERVASVIPNPHRTTERVSIPGRFP